MTENDGAGETDNAAAGLPIEGYPGLRAGDFADGEGVLGIALGLLGGNNSRIKTGFDTPEEARHISEVETPAAKALGEPVRSDHGGHPLPVRDPTWHTPMRRW